MLVFPLNLDFQVSFPILNGPLVSVLSFLYKYDLNMTENSFPLPETNYRIYTTNYGFTHHTRNIPIGIRVVRCSSKSRKRSLRRMQSNSGGRGRDRV